MGSVRVEWLEQRLVLRVIGQVVQIHGLVDVLHLQLLQVGLILDDRILIKDAVRLFELQLHDLVIDIDERLASLAAGL